jgi:acyl carrier protein
VTDDSASGRAYEISRASDAENGGQIAPLIDGPALLAILTRVAGHDRTPARVGVETPIGENGLWLDSVDLVEVVLACEETFAVELDPSSLYAAKGDLTVAQVLAALRASRRR